VALTCGPDEPGTWLPEIAAQLSAHLGADGCIVYVVDAAAGELVAVAVHPPVADVEVGSLRLPLGFGVTGRVAVDRIPATLVDDEPRNGTHRALMGLAPGRRVSRLCLPALGPDGTALAVLAVHERSSRAFTPHDVAVGLSVAGLVGLRLQRDAALTEVRAHESAMDGLVAVTVAAQEAERRRVAADLHDGVTQVIASLAFHLSAAEIALGATGEAFVLAQVRAARELADLAFVEARNAISGLRSPVLDDLGLAAGLESLARSVPQLVVDVEADDVVLSDHVATALYRVAQECVQNAVKHAEATRVHLLLTQIGTTVTLTVSDDGRGFDPQRRGPAAPGGESGAEPGEGPMGEHRYGLVGMHERVQLLGGRLVVDARPGAGTTVRATIPLHPAE